MLTPGQAGAQQAAPLLSIYVLGKAWGGHGMWWRDEVVRRFKSEVDYARLEKQAAAANSTTRSNSAAMLGCRHLCRTAGNGCAKTSQEHCAGLA